MKYEEIKKDNKYVYRCRDVFGEVILKSKTKLDGDTLDRLTSVIINGKENSGLIDNVEFELNRVKPDSEEFDTIVTSHKYTQPQKSRATAFLLAFFLGTFGAHRFYVGKAGTGIAQLILSLSIIGLIVSSVWVLIDWIMILSGSFKDKRGNTITEW